MTTNPTPIDPIKLPLNRAEMIAEMIKGELTPFCSAIAVAGSIRRKRPSVGDIDLVCLAKDELQEHITRKRIMRSNPYVMEEGDQSVKVVLTMRDGPVQLDVWFAKHPTQDLFGPIPGTWGTVLMCRTGSMAHNIKIASLARARSWHWNPHRGLFDQNEKWVAGETEESIYEALEIRPMQPEERD
jgi:DNA polymerase (family 10)